MSAVSSSFDAPGYLKTLTQQPGVYRMLDAEEKLLYVGKAKNFKETSFNLF